MRLEPPFQPRSAKLRFLVIASLAIAAACRPGGPDGRGSSSELLRTIEARVSLQVVFRPCGPLAPPSGELRPPYCGPPPSREGRARLLPLARDRTSTVRSLAAAVALSAEAEALTQALQRLETRSGSLPSVEQQLALGAIEHALALASGDPANLLPAFEHTEAALARDPSSLVGLFNRGLIASDLGLCRLAARTWRQYRTRDPASGWAQEASERLALLPCAGERKTIGGPSPEDVFTSALERLLPLWIEARQEISPTANKLLNEIARSGEELHDLTGEPMIRELARELETASDPGFLAGVAALVEGRQLFEAERYRDAGRELRIAARLLRERRGWLAPWADIWLSGIDLNQGSFAAAEDRLARLADSPELARSPYLRGRIFWTLGLAGARAGRLQTAYDRLLRAEEEFARGRYVNSAAAVRILRAESMAHLGLVPEAWRPRILALRVLQEATGRFSFFHNGLLDGAGFAQRNGAFAVADAFLSEAAEVARSRGNTASEIEALLARARALRFRGDHAAASADLRRALGSIHLLPPDLRERFERIAMVGLWADPAHSGGDWRSELLAAADFFSGTGPYSLQLQALRVKAAREHREGDLLSARRTLDGALEVIRRLQKDIQIDEAGIRHLESVQELFDEAIELAIAEDQPLEALRLLEAARRHGMQERGAAEALAGLHLEVADGPPPGGGEPVVVVLCLTPQSFVWWRLDGRAVRWGRSEAARVRAAVRAVLGSVPSGRVTPAELQRLHAVLLGQALRDVPPGRPLVLVPDGLLQRVPFSMLQNSETGVRLIEERAVSLRTSLRAARETTADRHQRRVDWSVTAVGDPAFDTHRLPLLRLPGAAREAAEVAGIYGGRARLLVGEAATAEAVGRAAGSAEVLHLAAHAAVSNDGFRDALVLAANPEIEESGLTGVVELLPASTSLRLVVLSGCSTLGLHPSRSGGLLGLASAFVARGVPATVGTLWRVDDRVLPDLLADFHRFLIQGESAAEALRQAQLAHLARNPSACCDWAALQLIGDLPAEPPSPP
jgi:tetratricopeptide (TPR) repeat protein